MRLTPPMMTNASSDTRSRGRRPRTGWPRRRSIAVAIELAWTPGISTAACQHSNGGEDVAVDLEGTGALGVGARTGEVVGGAATVLTGQRVAGLVDLTQCALDEGRRGAQERDHPHPEEGAGAAESDSGCDAGDVSGSNSSGHSRTANAQAVSARAWP